MLYLTCGTPGSGKTLWTINHVESLRKKSGRQVFYNGINELMLDWTLFDDPRTWPDLPDGSIIVIDECQISFPNRRQTGVPPDYISKFETHRHRGFDIFLITQNPQLMDNHVRKLVGEYRFLDRPANMNYSVVWKFRHVVDWKNTTERQGAEKERWKYPKESFGWYKSAEVHTHKSHIPKFLYWIPVCLSILGFCGYTFYNTLFNKEKKDESTHAVSFSEPIKNSQTGSIPTLQSPQPSKREVLTTDQYIVSMIPRIPEFPHSAQMYDEIAKPTTIPKVAACIESKTDCQCWTQQATRLHLDSRFCLNFVKYGQFDPFVGGPEQQRQAAPAHVAETPQPSKDKTASHIIAES